MARYHDSFALASMGWVHTPFGDDTIHSSPRKRVKLPITCSNDNGPSTQLLSPGPHPRHSAQSRKIETALAQRFYTQRSGPASHSSLQMGLVTLHRIASSRRRVPMDAVRAISYAMDSMTVLLDIKFPPSSEAPPTIRIRLS
ncbi:hypothetical protein BD779DRAFT_1467307 [Infundibulicybe gibba]|nr:hypothetical protein BD779DRAFT_1476296 [Infundibulicybe gibba]KAF8886785.1 hypothetical protein BD779DRAFT_1471035 [Infundibulicybe gibba]KAF8894750.1 hypothetical protein BD779DRAFT_1467307 [Infundibulicybe gibba]